MLQKITLTFTLTLLLSFLIPSLSFAQYCMPTADCTLGDGITNFAVGSFSNPSECGADNDVAGYSDFTGMAGLELAQGVPYNVMFTSGYTDQQVSAWLDVNNNQTFEPLELLLVDIAVGTEPTAVELTIPTLLPLGTYVLRIQSAYDIMSSDDPCTMPTYGETEDYTLTIVATPDCIPVSGLTASDVTSNSVAVSWTENGDASAWDVELVQAGGIPTGTPNATYDDIANPVSIMGLSALTSYDIYVRADCGTDNVDVSAWTGPLTVTTTPSCPDVTELATGLITTSTVELTWTENGSASAWDVELVQEGGMPTGTPSSAYDDISNPTTIAGLSAATSYDVYVRADCGMDNNSDVSEWTGPLTITTNCEAYTPFYYEAFDAPEVFGTLPQCWSQANEGTPTDGPSDLGLSAWTQDGFANDGFNGSYKVNLYLAQKSDWLISPDFDLTGGSFQAEFDLSFTVFGNQNATNLGSDDEIQFLISDDNGTSWTALQVWTAADNVNPLGDKIIHDLTSYAGSTVKFAFYATEGTVDDAEDNDIFVDNFYVRTPPSCSDVSGLTPGAITPSSIEMSWTENGSATMYDVEIVPTGEMPTGTPTFDNVSNPTTLTGLDAISTYDIYVRADCDGDNSNTSLYAGPITVSTLCDVFFPPYLEQFDAFLPECWNEAGAGNPSEGPSDLGEGFWGSDGFANDGFDGAAKINLYTNNRTDWLLTPQFDLTGNNFQAEFDFSITDFGNMDAAVLGSDDEVQFLISADNGASWITLQSWTAADNVNPLGEKLIYDLTAYADMTVQFAFWGTDGTVDDDEEDVDVFVDNFYVRTPPTCVEVSGIVSSEITDSQALVSWTENGSATLYDIELVLVGETPTGTPTATGVTNPYTILGLDAATEYEIYVRAACDASIDDYSLFVGSAPFTTPCSSFTPDYLEDFTNADLTCWEQATAGDLSTGPMEFPSSNWGADGFANDGTEGAYRINVYSDFLSDWLLSPFIDLTSATNVQAEFDIALTTYADTTADTLGSDDRIYFLSSTDNGATWTPEILWSANSIVSNTGEHIIVDLASYVGSTVRFAFYASDGAVDDDNDIDFFIDNFEVKSAQIPLSATATATDETCAGSSDGSASATTTGGLEPYMYLWNNNETTPTITGLAGGNYSCVITDAAGNSFTTPEVTVNQGTIISGVISATAETLIGLNDGTATVEPNDGTTPYTFTWSNGATTQTITDLAPGEFCVTVTDNNGCEFTECVNVAEGVSSVTPIDDLTKISVSPNPVGNANINLTALFASPKNISVSLINSTGQVLTTTQFDATQAVNTVFDMSDYPASLYILKLTDMDTQQVLTRRVIKQ